LYLQTHSTDEPPRAVSVLFYKGQVLSKNSKSIASSNDMAAAKATEAFHIQNLNVINRIVLLSQQKISRNEPDKLLKIVRLLINWGLIPEAVKITRFIEVNNTENADILQIKGEVQIRSLKYGAAFKYLKKSYKVSSQNCKTLLLLALCYVNILLKKVDPAKQELIEIQLKKCLRKLKVLDSELSENIDLLLPQVTRKQYKRVLNKIQSLLLKY